MHASVLTVSLAVSLSTLCVAQLSHCSVDYMTLYRDTALHTRETVRESIAVGRSYINKCVELDAQMQKVEAIAAQLADVDEAVGSLERSFHAMSRQRE